MAYFHGFMSSAQSSKIEMLKVCLPDFEIVAPDIPVDPIYALPFLKNLCHIEQPDIVLGKCMGGMYAQQMFGFKRICINPAFFMSRFSKILKIGTIDFFNYRKDGSKQFTITQEIIDHFTNMEECQFDSINQFDKENVYGLFLENEDAKRYLTVFQKYYKNYQYFPMTYRVDFQFIKTIIAPMVTRITS